MNYILPVSMFDFDANLINDIWKRLATSPARALSIKSAEIHGYNTRYAAKGINRKPRTNMQNSKRLLL